jgi:hypothetical protein
MPKIGKQKYKDENANKKILNPVEDLFSLETFLSFEMDGRKIGAALLKHKAGQAYKLQFGFECRGIHSLLREEQIDPIFDDLEMGLADFPSEETLSVHLGSFVNDTDRQRELTELFQNNQVPELKFLLAGEQKRIRELTEKNIRKTKFLRLYCTYTISPEGKESLTNLEKFLAQLETGWLKFTGEFAEVYQLNLHHHIYRGYVDGLQIWEQFLRNKLGLTIRSLSASEIWENLWEKFNDTKPRPLPQVVVYTSDRIEEKIHTQLHPLSLLLESETSIPKATRRWTKINNKYVGTLTLEEKPGGWINKESQLRYLWDVLSDERVSDTEIICQIQAGNPKLLINKMRSLTKQANMRTIYAAQGNDVDVNAELRYQKTIDAQAALFEGSVPLYLGIVFQIYRDTSDELDEACRYFQSLFKRPAWVVRETEYPWRIWAESLSITWERLLCKPFHRRSIYLSSEAPGLIPLVKTRTCDRSGFELIGEDGGTPIHIDLYSQHKNLGIFGTTRSGKSVLVAGILVQALARGIPISAIDFPRPDGTGTFSDLCEFLGDLAAYYDIGSESCNLFEPPDLRKLAENLQKERFADYQDYLLGILTVMILGVEPRQDINPDLVRSLLGLAIDKFFVDAEIRKRYAEAFISGFGTPEWLGIPTLVDFVSFCSLERLQLISPSAEIVSTLEHIKLRLKFWISSKVGSAISKPTSFRSTAPLLVVALRNLSNQEDAVILAMATYMESLRRALASPISIFFVDEAPILFEYEGIADLVGRLCANGAKSGIRVILSAQEPNSIAQTRSAPKIFANLTTRLIGRIQPMAVDSFVDILKYPEDIIGYNSTEAFFPNKADIYSNWLLDDNGFYTPCRYYPSLQLLSVVANNTDEVLARKEAISRSKDHKLVAIAKFAEEYAIKIRQVS